MIEALKTVVTKDGTAPGAALKHYVVAGKTGTAQKAENGVYVPGKYLASFIGFFPADNPELCISVVMDEPKEGYYGGRSAARCFKRNRRALRQLFEHSAGSESEHEPAAARRRRCGP
jgi:cell division protein FtsI/penicillin-binding protein 2